MADEMNVDLVRLIDHAVIATNRREADVLDRIRIQIGKDDVEAWNALNHTAFNLRLEADKRELRRDA